MRLAVLYGNLLGTKVSIHASVKDATDLGNRKYIIDSFNPRICKRCDEVQTPRYYHY